MEPVKDGKTTQTVTVTKRRFSIGIGILAFFLTFLLLSVGETVLRDVEDVPTRPSLETIQERYQDKALLREKETAEKALARAEARVKRVEEQQQRTEETYLTAKDMLDALVQVKNARASAAERPIGSEASQLVGAQARYLAAKQQYQVLLQVRRESQKTVDQARGELASIQKRLDDKLKVADEEFNQAMVAYQLHVVLLRVLFVVPVVLLGLYLWARQRESRYAALVWAYLLFAAYVFLRGAYEYVPSFHFYGVRFFGIGILLIMIVMTIRYFHRTTDDRLMAEIQAHLLQKLCPNCKFPFLDGHARYVINGLGRLRRLKLGAQPVEVVEPPEGALYCRSCGLSIVDKCGDCQAYKYALMPFCPRCRAHTPVTERVSVR